MKHAEWLVSTLNDSFADVMRTMADSKPQMESAVISIPPDEKLLWWKQTFSCSKSGCLWLGASEQDWTTVGEAVLSSAGVESPPSDEIRSTWLEIVRQAMGGLADSISARISSETKCEAGLESIGPGPEGAQFQVSAQMSSSKRIGFCVVVSEALADSVTVRARVAEHTDEQNTDTRSESDAHYSGLAGSRTFELLLDVEMPVSISFGRATLRLQDAMNLVGGSLIELDRALSDPVELLVNNCVIARGEVVVVEGNYGVRLTEIISHKERLQQGRRHMLR